jgi:hypothetical protein
MLAVPPDRLTQVDPIIKKQVYAAVTTLALEAAKTDTSSEAIGRLMDEYGLPEARVKLVATLYNAQKVRVRDILSQTGVDLPSLVDADWRLGYEIRSSATGAMHTPKYNLRLKTKNAAGQIETIEFTCTRQQLKDLLLKVKDATKQVERLLTAMGGNTGKKKGQRR